MNGSFWSAPWGVQDRDDLVRAKPLLLREAVKEAVAVGREIAAQGTADMQDHETRRRIIRQWMALPKDKRQTADQAADFAKKGRRAEQVSAQQSRPVSPRASAGARSNDISSRAGSRRSPTIVRRTSSTRIGFG